MMRTNKKCAVSLGLHIYKCSLNHRSVQASTADLLFASLVHSIGTRCASETFVTVIELFGRRHAIAVRYNWRYIKAWLIDIHVWENNR